MGGMGGGEMGGMPGAPGGGGAPGGMAAAGGAQPMKILKRSKAKALEQQEEPVQFGQVRFTRIEQEFRKMLDNVVQGLKIQSPYFFQYKIEKTAGGQPYVLDFAFPELKVGLECDGSVWHDNPKQVQHDRQRDYELAMRGWTIIRFDDKTIEEQPTAVQNSVVTYLRKAAQSKGVKKASLNALDGEAHYHSVYANEVIDLYHDELPEQIAKTIFEE